MLDNGFIADGEVDFLGIRIGGNLDCEGGKFLNTNSFALLAESAEIKGSIVLRNGFIANGEVDLAGATVGGSLNCKGGQFFNSNTNRCALSGEGMRINGKLPQLAMIVRVKEVFFHCGKSMIRSGMWEQDRGLDCRHMHKP